jgi:putative membrane protein
MIVSWLATAVAFLLGAKLLRGVEVDGIVPALIAAFVLGLVNAVIKPVLFFLTLPITILTLGLFALVLNAMMVWLASLFVPGVRVTSLLSGVVLVIIIAITQAVAASVFG